MTDRPSGPPDEPDPADAPDPPDVSDTTDATEPDGARDSPGPPERRGDAARRGADLPIDGQALLLATAKASVGRRRLPELLARATAHLRERAETYRREYERVHAEGDAAVYLVERGHWADVGEELGLLAREADAVRRANEEHLLRLGSRLDRREEFERALEVREVAVVQTG